MNILFLTNYFGLHGSSIDLLTFAARLKKNHKVFFIGGDGFLKKRFENVAEDVYVQENRSYLPSFKNILLLKRLIKYWSIDVIIGTGKFKALEGQLACLFILKRSSIAILNFSRPVHWQSHRRWHVPKVGYITVNSEYYKDKFNTNYHWSSDRIILLAARYELPEFLDRMPNDFNNTVNVLFIRRLDFPKYKSILNSLAQLSKWEIWGKWSFKIIGSGSHEEIVQNEIAKIKSLHPEADITMLGNREDVIELMHKADIVIGSERVVVEAMSQGCLALLATDDGLVDIITPENIGKYSYDNFFGYNCQPLNCDEIKEKLFSILESQERIKEIIEGNFAFIKRHLDVKQGNEILCDLIQKSYESSLTYGDRAIQLFRVIKSWISIYLYLLKDKLSREL